MSSKSKFVLTIFLILITLLLGAGYYFSTEIISFRKRTIEEDKRNHKIKGFAEFGLPDPEVLRFQNGSITLWSWYFKNPAKKKCGVILLHGQTGTRAATLKYAPIFFKRGCSVFTYDARRHGESGGEYGTFGFYEKFDLDRAMEFFSEVSTIPESSIGILGESYGAATALQFAEGKKEISFLVADSTYKDMTSIIEKRAVDLYSPLILIISPIAIAFAEIRGDFVAEDVSPSESAKKIEVPTILIHSSSDEFTPKEHSEDIFRNLKTKHKKIWITEWGAGHGRSINTNYAEYERVLIDFLKENQINL
ncbi:MAG: alpha/beta hydrolase [Leptospira sp.]|nr:alpha/beta hydrolase [Leptospira sp.]